MGGGRGGGVVVGEARDKCPIRPLKGRHFTGRPPGGSGAAVCRWYALPDSRLILDVVLELI